MDTPNPSMVPQPLNEPPQPMTAPPQQMQQVQPAQPLPYQGIPGAQPPAVAIPAGPAMELPPLSFWQQPWVQNVLPLVTSLALHAAVVIVGILAWKTADLLSNTKPLEEQIIVASS